MKTLQTLLQTKLPELVNFALLAYNMHALLYLSESTSVPIKFVIHKHNLKSLHIQVNLLSLPPCHESATLETVSHSMCTTMVSAVMVCAVGLTLFL